MREGCQTEDAICGKADAHDHDDEDTPRVDGDSAERAIEAGGLIRVVRHRRSQEEEAHKRESDTATHLADRSEALGPPSGA